MNTIEMTLTSFNAFSRSVRVLCRTGRSILTRRHPLFAAPSPIQLLTKIVQDTTQHRPPLGILTPLCAVRSTLIEGAVGTDAVRTTADEIKTYIEARIATGS